VKQFVLFLVGFLLFIFDSIFSQVLAGLFVEKDFILVPYFMIVFVFFLTMYGPRKYAMMYGAILGLAYDVVYTEVLGIYMFLIPFLAYLISKCLKILQTNWFIVIVLSLIFVVISELIIYEMNVMMSFAKLNFSEFVDLRLVPTTILNFVFICVFYYPFKRLILHFSLPREVE
jgi:rod shape-determining protein MreD